MRNLIASGLALITLAAGAAEGAPQPYLLSPERSDVRFHFEIEGAATTGRLPVLDAEVMLDMARLSRSQVAVRLDARRARAGLFIVTEALRGPAVLDVANHPVIAFRSTAVRPTEWGALVEGEATVRGVTRPLTLEARLFREADSDPRDYSRLQVRLTGTLDRHDFGASGFAGLIGPEVALDIRVWIDRVQ